MAAAAANAQLAIKRPLPHRNWLHIDGKDRVVGRLASRIVGLLQGKHKPVYSPAVDSGDFVVVTNASKVILTGRKWDQKYYRWHTGYPGGLKEALARKWLGRFPERILQKAVSGMLPKNRLRHVRLDRLKIFSGPEHPHHEQLAHSIMPPYIARSLRDTLRKPMILDPAEHRDYVLTVKDTPEQFEMTVEHAPGNKRIPVWKLIRPAKLDPSPRGWLKSPPPPSIYDYFPEVKPPARTRTPKEASLGIFAPPKERLKDKGPKVPGTAKPKAKEGEKGGDKASDKKASAPAGKSGKK